MRVVRHKSDSGHVLFRYPYFEGLSDCDERIICLSERSFAIILNALEYSDKMRTRVYSSAIEDNYTLVGDTEWSNFQYWVSTVRTELGGYLVCNEILQDMLTQQTRIADALESLDQKAETAISLNEFVEDLGDALGIGNAFYLLVKAFSEILPNSSNVKINLGTWLSTIWRTKTFETPMLMANNAQAASLGTIAGAMGAAKLLDQLKSIIAGFSALNDYYDNIRDAMFGDWNVLSFMQSLLDWLIPDSEGGTGGDDPDNDPTLRTSVNNLININPRIILDCSSCGIGNHCSCSDGGSTPIDGTYVDNPPTTQPDRETEDPPTGNETWEEYDTNKCNHLHKFIDDYVATLRNWAGLFGMVGGLTAAIIIGITLLAVPPLGIGLILGALSILVSVDIAALAFFNTIADEIEDNRADLICGLMSQTNTSDMVSYFRDQMEIIISDVDLGPFEGEEPYFVDACINLVSNQALETSINNGGQSPEGYDEECDCGGACVFDIVIPPGQTGAWGSITREGTHYSGSSEVGDDCNRLNLSARTPGDEPCCLRMTNIVVTGATHTSGFDFWIPCGNTEYVPCPDNDVEGLEDECVHALALCSNTPFTIEFDVEVCEV